MVARELHTYPRDDDDFRAAVADALAGLATSKDMAQRLEAQLRLTYPDAVVHDGHELAELAMRPLYAYRDGSPIARS